MFYEFPDVFLKQSAILAFFILLRKKYCRKSKYPQSTVQYLKECLAEYLTIHIWRSRKTLLKLPLKIVKFHTAFYLIDVCCIILIKINYTSVALNALINYYALITAKKKLERLQFWTSSSFFKIWSACSGKFKAYFLTLWALYHLLFDLKLLELIRLSSDA